MQKLSRRNTKHQIITPRKNLINFTARSGCKKFTRVTRSKNSNLKQNRTEQNEKPSQYELL